MSEFRNIAPSTATGSENVDSNTSGRGLSSASTSTPGTSSGNWVPGLEPGNQSQGRGPSGGAESAAAAQRRRRMTGHVTALACTQCRRARAKCDGQRPASCTRCIGRQLQCTYEPHTKTQKADLLQELESVRAEQAGLQMEHSTLQQMHQGLTKQSRSMSTILDILTNNGHVDEVIRRLRAGDDRDTIADWLNRRPELRKYIDSDPQDFSVLEVVERVQNLYNGNNTPEEDHDKVPNHQWTSVTQSTALISHLFELYFTWVHPLHMLFSENMFLQCYKNGTNHYCSRALVNAICAMGCCLLETPAPGFTKRHAQDESELQAAFKKEARSLLKPQGDLHVASLQAFAILYLVDLSCGKARSASGYLRCAADHLVTKLQDAHHDEVFEVSRWGIHTLNTAWSGITYQKPFNPQSPRSEISFNLDMTEHGWTYYKQPGDQIINLRRPSFAILTAKYQARLFRVVHESINIFCGARGRVHARPFLDCYKRYIEWKDTLPEDLKYPEGGEHPSLPHVLSLHVQYNTAIVQMFLPLIESEYFAPRQVERFRRIICSHAKDGLVLLKDSRKMKTCRYLMPLTSFCIAHLGYALVRYDDASQASEVAEFTLETLQLNKSGFAICGPLQQMFRDAIADQEIVLSEDLERRLGPIDQYDIDAVLDACTRLTFLQPTEQIVQWVHRNIGEEWDIEWNKEIWDKLPQLPAPKKRQDSRGASAMEISNLLNN